jgi:2-polyprenyl-6-methoxyphenol hydroxylase-like FAD-dependent oxidoreductase/predicted DsbA family dithiol-disulfide isomerase
MKTVILGGGIAGLAMGILLHKKGFETVICERDSFTPAKGNAFLMHAEGVSILKDMMEGQDNLQLPGAFIDRFSLRKPSNEEVKFQKLDPWQCIKRKDIVDCLEVLYPPENIKRQREFSHFIYEGEKAIAAVFKNGTLEYGDFFIGADGCHSKVREALFGETQFSKTEVKEVLGLLKNPSLSKQMGSRFTKFQHHKKSISFGLIPCSTDELVWYIQYDPKLMDIHESSAKAMGMFCSELLKDFPPLVHDVLEYENFEETYIWHTRDFDLLQQFHRQNVVLIGDAAHLSLPFTSAGTTNALVDAHTLATLMGDHDDLEIACNRYYHLRAEHIDKQIQLGRSLKQDFLNPESKNEDDLLIPLISKQERAIRRKTAKKEINILYFTDPICSTCWIIQPQLRKLQLEYENHVNIEYKMGGLLPSWENFNRNGISKPSDVAAHWEQVCSFYEMPINKDVWLEDPLPSSYPPSIAFKAAQIQDTGKAVLFLRRIREMVFLEKKNIIKKEYLHGAAYDVGLDAARLLRDLEGKAQALFREDLVMADELQIKVLPTLFFSNTNGMELTLNGYQPYENFEDIIKQMVPGIRKGKYDTSPRYLFKRFQTMTSREFALLRNENEFEAQFTLNELLINDLVKQYESPAGSLWMSNFENRKMTNGY